VKVALLGVGLIGGSIGLAARERAGARVVGYDPDPGVLSRAVELGAIDERAGGIAEAVAGADFAFVATPVGAAVEVARVALAAAGPGCVVSDVGSTKREICAAISDPRFVGGHPLAGAETAGVEGARGEMFEGAIWYLTSAGAPVEDPGLPTGAVEDRVSMPAGERMRGLVERLGARAAVIDPEGHDRLMASVSHLPHVLANVLVAQAWERVASEGSAAAGEGSAAVDEGSAAVGEGSAAVGERAASGGDGALEGGAGRFGPSFRDATRVAGANTAIWTDIYLANREALVAAIDDAVRRLGEVRAALAAADAEALAAWNERARGERERLRRAGPVAGP
jgi:prephenate dehydrogenase